MGGIAFEGLKTKNSLVGASESTSAKGNAMTTEERMNHGMSLYYSK